MNPLELLLIALSLAMDAFSVSIAFEASSESKSLRNSMKMAFSFGTFQAAMPILGWFAGSKTLTIISGIDHWIAFSILLIIGLKMISGTNKLNWAFTKAELTFRELMMLSVATSIDALAVGIGFALLEFSIAYASVVIGATAFAMTLIGAVLGRKMRTLLAEGAGFVGGILLIAIGAKILIEHI